MSVWSEIMKPFFFKMPPLSPTNQLADHFITTKLSTYSAAPGCIGYSQRSVCADYLFIRCVFCLLTKVNKPSLAVIELILCLFGLFGHLFCMTAGV